MYRMRISIIYIFESGEESRIETSKAKFSDNGAWKLTHTRNPMNQQNKKHQPHLHT
jgi:hypothetical protein